MRCDNILILVSLVTGVYAQLRKDVPVGASTPLSKKTRICNIVDFGAKPDGKTDAGQSIQRAYDECCRGKPNTKLLIPEGQWLLRTGVQIEHADSLAIEIRGQLNRDKHMTGNNMIWIYKSRDVEIYGVNDAAFQGNGYLNRLAGENSNTRLLRLEQVTDCTVRNLFLIDSPAFALNVNDGKNVEVYGITIRNHNKGGSDGIDFTGDNIHVHDSTVTNRDDCVVAKSPASNCLVEDITCNHSAGISLGSFFKNTAIENIVFRRVQTYQCYHFFMIKSFINGDGYVRNILVQDVSGYDNNYGIDVDQYWLHIGQKGGATGVKLSNIKFDNLHGTTNSGIVRGAIRVLGSDAAPIEDMEFSNIRIWDPRARRMKYSCINVYGSGGCAFSAAKHQSPRFANEYWEKTPPKGFVMPQKPAWAIDGFGETQRIPLVMT